MHCRGTNATKADRWPRPCTFHRGFDREVAMKEFFCKLFGIPTRARPAHRPRPTRTARPRLETLEGRVVPYTASLRGMCAPIAAVQDRQAIDRCFFLQREATGQQRIYES